MELSSEEIVKLIERVSGIPDVLKKQGDLDDLIRKFNQVEEYLARFGSLEDLTSHLKEIEDRIYLCKTYLTTNEAAAYVAMSKFTLLEAAKRRELPFYTPPSKCFYFSREELDKWINGFRIPSNQELMEEMEKETDASSINKVRRI